jgi:type II secretory pathway component GspD/PulD (secretin)
MADGAIYCEVSPEVSNVIDFIGNIPRVARRSMVGEAILSNGGVVVLGGLTTDTDRRNTNGLAGLDVFNTRKRDEARSRLFVFVTVHQVN